MKKIIVGLVAVVIAGFCVIQFMRFQDQHAQEVMAKELRKAISATMLDLSQAKGASIQGVPADGRWYHAVNFNTKLYGVVDYHVENRMLIRGNHGSSQQIAKFIDELNIRRLPADKLIVEVKIILRNKSILTSNFRVRIQE